MHPQSTYDDRLRRTAVRLIKVAETKTGALYYGPGILLTVPVKPALERLVDLHKRAVGERPKSARVHRLPVWGARILHRRETVSILGTLTGAKREHRCHLLHAIITFAEEHQSVEGI